MGRASTLAGHLANAEDLRLRTGTIVFVVQQLPGTTADPAQAGEEILGHVLLSRRKAMPVPQASTWAVHVASRGPERRPIPYGIVTGSAGRERAPARWTAS